MRLPLRGKSVLIASMLCLSFLAQAKANITCQKEEFGKVSSQDKIYSFSVSRVCLLNNIKTVSLQSIYKEAIEKNINIDISSEEETDFSETMSGYTLGIVERIKTNHGRMRIEADVKLMSNNVDKFVYEYQSSSITGSGHAANTKSAMEKACLKKEEGVWKLTLVKEIKVKKPWIAPEGMFIREVKKGLKEDIKPMTEKNISIIK